MAQTKIYPSTQAQVAAVDAKADQILTAVGQIGQPRLQTKTVTPTLSQQIIQPDNGYDALSSVVVAPAPTTDLDNWISRNEQADPLYIVSAATSIPYYACYMQKRLVSFSAENASSIGGYAFSGCASLQEVDLHNATSVGNYAFSNCTSLQEVDLHNTTSVGEYAFNGAYISSELDLSNLTSAGQYAFYNSSGLTKIFLPELRSANYRTFAQCTSQIAIFPSLTTLGQSSVEGCNSLKYIDIRKVNTIAKSAFWNSSGLKLIDITSKDTPPTLDASAFNNTAGMVVVVKNDEVKEAFQAATNWSNYASKIKTIAEIEAEVGMTYDEYYYQIFGQARNEVAA